MRDELALASQSSSSPLSLVKSIICEETAGVFKSITPVGCSEFAGTELFVRSGLGIGLMGMVVGTLSTVSVRKSSGDSCVLIL